MKTIAYLRWADPPVWQATLANSLPIWLLALVINPGLPFPAWIAGMLFLLAVAMIMLLLWLGWLTPELILYSLLSVIPMFFFEDMSARYETYFILLCALTLTIGIFGYQLSLHKDILGLGWLILLVAFVGTWMLASHANQNYWQMVSTLGYVCAPDMPGCAPLPDNMTPWWILFFHL